MTTSDHTTADTVPATVTTGVTGHLGHRVAQRIAALGLPQTMIARQPNRAPRLAHARVMPGSYGDAEKMRDALAGAQRALLVSAHATPDRTAQQATFIDAAADAGVQMLVYISFCDTRPDATFHHARDHWRTEQHLAASGIPYVILRNTFYSEFIAHDLLDGRTIHGPADDGHVAPIALDDVADAATAVLTGQAGTPGTTYNLTGPTAISLDHITDVLSDRSGRRIAYRPETAKDAREVRADAAPRRQVDAWISTYRAIAAGEASRVTDTIPALTQHRARPFELALG